MRTAARGSTTFFQRQAALRNGKTVTAGARVASLIEAKALIATIKRAMGDADVSTAVVKDDIAGLSPAVTLEGCLFAKDT